MCVKGKLGTSCWGHKVTVDKEVGERYSPEWVEGDSRTIFAARRPIRRKRDGDPPPGRISIFGLGGEVSGVFRACIVSIELRAETITDVAPRSKLFALRT